MTPPPPPCDSARLAFIGELGGLFVYGGEAGALVTHDPKLGWRHFESLGDLVREANARIVALERGRTALIAVLAAFPLMLTALLVMALSRPLGPPGLALSLAAAVIGCFLTGALVFLGASVAAAVFSPRRSPAPAARPA
jgi:hypothetical protein